MDELSLLKEVKGLIKFITDMSYKVVSLKVIKGKDLFYTKKDGINLFDIFLINLPPEVRHYFNHRSFKEFFNTYGSVAIITSNGELRSVVWDERKYYGIFQKSIIACRKIVEYSLPNGEFEISSGYGIF